MPAQSTLALTKEQENRFWPRVAIGGIDDCWPWLAGAHGTGYGYFWRDGKLVYAHRLAYAAAYGDPPDGCDVHHRCENHACCNPLHLEPLTKAEHALQDGHAAAVEAAKTHCANNHEYTPANTYTTGGRRVCKQCHRASQARKRERQAATTRSLSTART